VGADSNKIRILGTCGKCKDEVSRIVSPTQFGQLRKVKKIYEVLDDTPNTPLGAANTQELYSRPSSSRYEASKRFPPQQQQQPQGFDDDDESDSESEDDDDVEDTNEQKEMIQSLGAGSEKDPPSIDDCEGSLKRMDAPPSMDALKELGSSSYNFKSV
jgi:hypothetical protein